MRSNSESVREQAQGLTCAAPRGRICANVVGRVARRLLLPAAWPLVRGLFILFVGLRGPPGRHRLRSMRYYLLTLCSVASSRRIVGVAIGFRLHCVTGMR